MRTSPPWTSTSNGGSQIPFAAIRQAIRLLRRLELEDDCAATWEDWDRSGDRELWAATSDDGLA